MVTLPDTLPIGTEVVFKAIPSTGETTGLEYRRTRTLPDFSIADVNPTSPRFGDQVSPRDYLEAVSGWYFGHAT